MLGWMILFALMPCLTLVAAMTGNSVQTSMWIISIVFVCLFLVALLTRAARGRAW
jgi:Ca2+/H+ antiporter